MVTSLTKKMMRDLVGQAVQVGTIAVVIGCGVAAFVSMRGTWKSLELARDLYYERYRFGDVFVHLERAPLAVRARLEDIPGVALVETRLVEPVRLVVSAAETPPLGQVMSLPSDGRPRLDDLRVYKGRPLESGRDDEVLILSAFAEAHGLALGDTLPLVMHGHQFQTRIVGYADAPEFVYAIAPGEFMPDPTRFGVVWMDERAVAAAYRMDGAFDDVVLRLQPGADPEGVLESVDDLLEPYGGLGAVRRDNQISNKLLTQEMGQLRALASTIPIVFLAVAAFLVQVALGRMVQLQRVPIATLKAFGYTRGEIARHFFAMIAVVGVVGAVMGLGVGTWFGRAMTDLYRDFFALPTLSFRLDGELVLVSLGVSMLAAISGALGTVLQIANMPPAEAMQPPAPPTYSRGLIERCGGLAMLGPAARMAARDMLRRPLRLMLSIAGIAAATAVVVIGRFGEDAIDAMEGVIFDHVQAEDISVTFAGEVPDRAVRALGQLPGVNLVEGQRAVAARFSSGGVYRDGALLGWTPDPHLRRLIEWPFHTVAAPEQGLVLTDELVRVLGLSVGDLVEVELLGRGLPTVMLPLAGSVREPAGLQGHVGNDTLARLLGGSRLATHAFLAVDPQYETEVVARLSQMPGVLGVSRKSSVLASFRAQTRETRSAFVWIASLFGAALAVGIVYNNARVALSARARELASLRVLGFTRSEVSGIVLGEQAVHVLIGVPVGLFAGHQAAVAMMSTVDPETWRFPVVIATRTYGFAAAVVLGAALISGLFVFRQVSRLDLVAVLKTKE